MCLAVPMKIETKDGSAGVVSYAGGRYDVRLDFVPDAKAGDYVIVHTGVAINKLDEDEALETLKLFEEIDEISD